MTRRPIVKEWPCESCDASFADCHDECERYAAVERIGDAALRIAEAIAEAVAAGELDALDNQQAEDLVMTVADAFTNAAYDFGGEIDGEEFALRTVQTPGEAAA